MTERNQKRQTNSQEIEGRRNKEQEIKTLECSQGNKRRYCTHLARTYYKNKTLRQRHSQRTRKISRGTVRIYPTSKSADTVHKGPFSLLIPIASLRNSPNFSQVLQFIRKTAN